VPDDGSCKLKHVAQYYVTLKCCVDVLWLSVAIHVKSLALRSCFSSIIHTCYITVLVWRDFIHHIIFRKEHISETGSVFGGEKVSMYLLCWFWQRALFLITGHPVISLSIAWAPTWSILITQVNSKQFWQKYITFRITSVVPPWYSSFHCSLAGLVLCIMSSRWPYYLCLSLRDLGFSLPPVRFELLIDIWEILPFDSIQIHYQGLKDNAVQSK